MDEANLIEKLRKIEALHAGATTSGEREAASNAAQRIRDRLTTERDRGDIEIQYSLPDRWERQLFLALCRRYGLEPFRLARQRYSTVIVKAPERFQRDTLYPEFRLLATELTIHLAAVAERVIREAIHVNAEEAPERETLSLAANAR